MSTQGDGLNLSFNATAELPRRIPAMGGTSAERRFAVSAQSFRRVMTVIEVGSDFLTSTAAVLAAYYTYFALSIGRHLYYPPKDLALLAIIVGLLVVFLFERDSAYRSGTSLMRIRETERALKIPSTALVLVLPLTWLIGQSFSRYVFMILAVILPVSLIIQRFILSSAVRALHAKGYGIRRVLIYGAGMTGRRLFTALLHSPRSGYTPVAVLDDDPALEGSQIFELGYSRDRFFHVDKGPVTEAYLRSIGCDNLFIAIPSLPREALFESLQAAAAANVEVAFLPDRRHLHAHASETVDVDGLLLTFAGESKRSSPHLMIKRAFDFALASLLLLILSPVLLILAVLIHFDSPGPVLFRQERVGLNGKLFQILKFRTMHVDAPKYAKSPVLSDDRRITGIGKLLRKTSLDELPQLWNVVRGEMSLVGPRPEMPFLVEQYGPVQRQRLQVMPGITGLWQLSADRAFLIHESPEYDLYYIRNRGLFLDLAILIHTLAFAMRGV